MTEYEFTVVIELDEDGRYLAVFRRSKAATPKARPRTKSEV
jgi:hypothetical protein